MKYMQLAWRNIGRNRRRTVLSITAVMIASMAVLLLFGLITGMMENMAQNLIDYYVGEVRIRNAEYEPYEHLDPLHLSVANVREVLTTVTDLPETRSAVPRISTGGVVFRGEERIGLLITGVDFARERSFSGLEDILVAGEIPTGTPTTPADGPRLIPAVVGTGVLDRLEVELGDQFTVMSRTALRGSNAMSFQVVGIADFPVPAINESGFWAPLSDVQRMLRMDNQASQVLVKLNDRVDPVEATARISAALDGVSNPMQIQYWKDIETTYAMLDFARTMYNFMGLILFVLASTVIINTTMMAIFERKQEIGTLAAMGMTPGGLIRLFVTEATILAMLGTVAGLILGGVIGGILGKVGINLTDAMEGVDYELSNILYPHIRGVSVIFVFFASTIVGSLASLMPTSRIARIQPVEALRDE